jgi:CAAX prenyl protease-like protein
MRALDVLVTRYRWIPYVAPMATFLALTAVEGVLASTTTAEGRRLYPWLYGGKLLAVAVVAWLCRSTWHDLGRPTKPGTLPLAIALGVLIGAMWVGVDPYYPRFAWLGTRSAFDPMALPNGSRQAFLFLRSLGLVAVVPLIEELFWRSFLMRWIIRPEFWQVPIGKVTPTAAAATSALFALAHPEWFPALLTGLLWAWLLWHTKSLLACVVSHAAANATLGAIVAATGRWEFL